MTHSSERGSWRIDFLDPGPGQAGLVRRFHAYADRSAAPLRRREPPNGLATLVFNLGPVLHVEHPLGTRASFGPGAGFYSGVSARYAITETTGAEQGVQVMLTPLGARRLLGRPLQEVGDALIDPGDLLGAAGRELAERLGEAESHAARLAIIGEATERLVAKECSLPGDLVWAMQRLQASAGRLAIASLTDEIGCSPRHFVASFRQQFGITPKLFARVLRFDRAARLLRRDRVRRLADHALDCGYADQSHMTRDFVEFAGCAPSAFTRRSLPDEGGLLD